MKLRSCSIALSVLSLLAPGAYIAYSSWRFQQWAETQTGGVCGMPLLAVWALGVLAMCVLSVAALGLGMTSFVRLPAPRPRRRLVELVVLALPLIGASSLIAFAILLD
ncbi:hypothetical protein [Xanthomonas medicagonis]|uniref:hypothetical protein n=1 Tax=Xanthomonas medicagonis TaxID=3160841 RepID=UPI00351876BB